MENISIQSESEERKRERCFVSKIQWRHIFNLKKNERIKRSMKMIMIWLIGLFVPSFLSSEKKLSKESLVFWGLDKKFLILKGLNFDDKI